MKLRQDLPSLSAPIDSGSKKIPRKAFVAALAAGIIGGVALVRDGAPEECKNPTYLLFSESLYPGSCGGEIKKLSMTEQNPHSLVEDNPWQSLIEGIKDTKKPLSESETQKIFESKDPEYVIIMDTKTLSISLGKKRPEGGYHIIKTVNK